MSHIVNPRTDQDTDAAGPLHVIPQPTQRPNKRFLMIAGSIVGVTLFVVVGNALQHQRHAPAEGKELVGTGRNPMAESLNAIPSAYDALPKPPVIVPTVTPAMPPLPTITDAAPARAASPMPPPLQQSQQQRPQQGRSAEDEAARQLAKETENARLSPVFFPSGNPEKTGRATASRAAAPTRDQITAAVTGATTSPAQAISTPRTSPTFSTANGTIAGAVGAADSAGFALPAGQVQQAGQDSKAAFVNARGDQQPYSAYHLIEPASPYELKAGTVIAAAMDQGIISDLPGTLRAWVTENIYDTVTGRFLLVPQGSRLIGTYDTKIAYGQSRVLVVWTRLIMPDGSSIMLDRLIGTDAGGFAGLEDEVDYHLWRLLGSAILTTLLDVGSQYTTANESDIATAIRQSSSNTANDLGKQITKQNLTISPTITIRPGAPVRVMVTKDMVLRPYRSH